MTICYCGNHLPFQDCCQPYIDGLAKAPTAEALMRSRYSAYATGAADYLVATTHASTRKKHKKADILEWSTNNKWTGLEIIEATETTVTFMASYLDNRLQPQVHQEKSTFVYDGGSWFYLDGAY
ncbi:YchJ family protein [Flavobacterium sp.]|uniref:YchJ family protein n=1 Tax=Flavobacterium sp. TaxID=239 RepID=UPI003753A331